MKRFVKIFFLFLFLFYTFFFTISSVSAVNMDSASYSIQFGNLNFGSGKETSASYTLTNTMGQTAAQQFSSAGYIVKAGFQYIYTIIPFSFSVSNRLLNLGTLTPNTFSTDSTTLTVSFGSAGTYQVTAITEGALRTVTGSSIPVTNCDSGCTLSSAGTWSTASNNGWGYWMSGTDIPADFASATKYRPFPNRVIGDAPAIVMSSTDVGKTKQALMTVKTSISATQATGKYQTVISFVATPGY